MSAEDDGVIIEKTTAEIDVPAWTLRFRPQVALPFAGGSLVAGGPSETGAGKLWWLNLEAGEHRLLLDENIVHLRYDRDGSVLAFSQPGDREGSNVFRLRAIEERIDIIPAGALGENDQIVVGAQDYLSLPAVRRFADGYLFAFDHGEQPGGGLWWANAHNLGQRRLLSGNVSHLEMTRSGSALAFTTNATGDRGGVFEVKAVEQGIAVEPLGHLDSMVSVVGPSEWGFVAVSLEGVWMLHSGIEPHLLVEADTTFLIPNSVAMLDDGTIYVGMNAFVLRLSPTAGEYKREWLLPDECDGLVFRGEECECRVVE